MFQTTHMRIAAVVLGLAAAGSSAALSGQTPAPAPAGSGPAAIGSGSFSPIVANLQKTLAFYALLGIEVPKGSDVTPQPFSVNPRLHSMLGTNGARERHVNARVPGGFTLEPIEFDGIDRRPARPKVQDPGAITLVVLVRDVDALLAKAAAAGVPVLTPGGKAVIRAGRVARGRAIEGATATPGNTEGVPATNQTRAVLIEDPDGRPVELRQTDPLPETAAPATSNVIGSRITMTVGDTERTMRL
jgi:catechol 2,3-dioxygenase-like lactoylglutathione lyase family enzyme